MNDIWDEKPNPTLNRTYGSIYKVNKMNDWLAKLRCEYYTMQVRLNAIEEWWLLFNQCIDSEAVKDKLMDILDLSEFKEKMKNE